MYQNFGTIFNHPLQTLTLIAKSRQAGVTRPALHKKGVQGGGVGVPSLVRVTVPLKKQQSVKLCCCRQATFRPRNETPSRSFGWEEEGRPGAAATHH